MATIALAGGGTGGHVYPALAIGDVLRDRGHRLLYYGDPDRIEATAAPAHGYDFRAVSALQYPRGGVVGKVRFGLSLLRAIVRTRGQLREDRVDLVLGVGGYISAPPVLAAWTLRLPAVVHEANAVPGLANQLGARVSTEILLTYESTRDRFPGKAPRTLVGVPVSQKILHGDRGRAAARYDVDPGAPVVMFVGGSLGAEKINELALACARHPARSYQVVHLTGRRYHGAVTAALGPPPPGVRVVDYETEMGDAYALADLVVCRCGSSTLGELCAAGRASVLVPSPNVTENHQEENARTLVEAGAAELLVERDWDLGAAVALIGRLAADRDRLTRMGRAAWAQARPDAAALAADVVERVLGRR